MTESGRPSRVRRSRMWNISLAVFFFLLGIVGSVFPVIPGVLFFAMSVFFLSMASPPVRRALRRFLHGHPKLLHRYNAWRHRRRQRRLERIRRARALAEKLHLHRHREEVESREPRAESGRGPRPQP